MKIADPLLKEIAEKCQFDNLKTADKSVRNDETNADNMDDIGLEFEFE